MAAPPTTGVTFNDVQLHVAFPANLVTDMDVTMGDYTVSGPETISIPGAPHAQYDVYTFTFTGDTTGETSPTNTSWPGSQLDTAVSFYNDICIPNSGESYFIRYTGSFTTDNGMTKDLDLGGWLRTDFL